MKPPHMVAINQVYDLDPINRKVLVTSREQWALAAQAMSKLRTYDVVKDFMDIGTMVHANLPRNQRSILAKFLFGILPIELQTGYFRNANRD